jgi:hypothetical protein
MGNTSNGMASPDGMVVFGFGRLGEQPKLTQPNFFMLSFLNNDEMHENTHPKLHNAIETMVKTLRTKLSLDK